MNYACLLKEVARGEHGARALSRADSAMLFADALAGGMPDGVLGALLVALRMKGETRDELLGLADAWRAQHRPLQWPAGAPRVIVLGSYNGARRQPNLLPLFACVLSRLGWPVLVHGVRRADGRVSSAEIFAAMGLEACESLEATERALATRGLAFTPIDVLSPALARLLAWRDLLGVRNLCHTLVKLINPGRGPACVVAGYTHGEYRGLMAELCTALEQPALLLRGTEGEPVAAAHRLPPPLLCVAGGTRELEGLELARAEAVCALDAASTARYTRRVLMTPSTLPPPLRLQAAALALAAGKATDMTAARRCVDAALGGEHGA